MMKCPNCIEKLSLTDSNGIQTYTCIYCSGIWVTAKALDILLKMEASDFTSAKIVRSATSVQSNKRVCASCDNQKLNIVNTHGIELDACIKCYGIFFDRDEIKKIFPNTHESEQIIGVGKAVATEGAFWAILAFISGC